VYHCVVSYRKFALVLVVTEKKYTLSVTILSLFDIRINWIENRIKKTKLSGKTYEKLDFTIDLSKLDTECNGSGKST
jgi:hypothetical protein